LRSLERDALEAIRSLGRGAQKTIADRAHSLICRRLAPIDTAGKNYQPAYRAAVNDVTQGIRSATDLEHAFLQAIHPTAKHSGKVFAHNWNHGQVELAHSI
jgi:hypothetical protein